MNAPRLPDAEVDAALPALRGWRREANELRCSYRFASFAAAVAFTQRIAPLAEEMNHHPAWTVRYRLIEIATVTHDVGGLTRLDLQLAQRLANLAGVLGGAVVAPDAAPQPPSSPSVAQPAGAALWVPAGHFYSPLTDRAEVEADAPRLFAPGLRELPGVDLRLPQQLALAMELARFYGEEDFPEQPRADRRYCLANEYFPYGDAFAYYALLRKLRPQRVIEVGAGWSSAVLLDTDERFLGGSIACTFVEPFPERLLALLRPADVARTRLLRQRLQDVALAEFDALAANDILFIDSSHVAKTGSDVLHALFTVLPRLRSGVWVHVHDVHANFEYPASWVREGRSWNENYFLRAFLMHNAAWQIELHGASLAEYAPELLLPRMPKLGTNVGGSIWLRKL